MAVVTRPQIAAPSTDVVRARLEGDRADIERLTAQMRPDVAAPYFEQIDKAIAEHDRLRAQRDYYRRRFIVNGIKWRGVRGWRQKIVAALREAQVRDV